MSIYFDVKFEKAQSKRADSNVQLSRHSHPILQLCFSFQFQFDTFNSLHVRRLNLEKREFLQFLIISFNEALSRR